MTRPAQDLVVEVADETGSVGVELLDELAAAARWVLVQENVDDAFVSLALVSDRLIAELNEDHLSHEGPTDVISFPLKTAAGPVVGDVYVGVEQAGRQAVEFGVELREELLRLVVHGTLHTVGWKHSEGEDRSDDAMYRRQEALLSEWIKGSAS